MGDFKFILSFDISTFSFFVVKMYCFCNEEKKISKCFFEKKRKDHPSCCMENGVGRTWKESKDTS